MTSTNMTAPDSSQRDTGRGTKQRNRGRQGRNTGETGERHRKTQARERRETDTGRDTGGGTWQRDMGRDAERGTREIQEETEGARDTKERDGERKGGGNSGTQEQHTRRDTTLFRHISSIPRCLYITFHSSNAFIDYMDIILQYIVECKKVCAEYSLT